MGEYSGSRAELPKNIRQIGERDEVVRLYVEDYVNTYLKQVYPSGGPGLRVGLLLGNSDPQQEVPCLFVDGALEMEEVVPSGEKIVFSEAAWKKAYQRMEETFPKKTHSFKWKGSPLHDTDPGNQGGHRPGAGGSEKTGTCPWQYGRF